MEAIGGVLGLVVIVFVLWYLGLLGVAANVTADAGEMAEQAMRVQKHKQIQRQDKFYTSNKVSVAERVQAEISKKQFDVYGSMDLEELEEALAKITAAKVTT